MALNIENSPTPCEGIAEQAGAFAYVDGVCCPVQGKTVKIGPSEYSVMEGFEIVNYNFHTNGNLPPAPTPAALPGAVDGFQGGV